jgi:DNA (cytosine-5)-methyltransferase 1
MTATTNTSRTAHPANGLATLLFAEFFSGVGLFRAGLERAGLRCVFANDIDAEKNAIYVRNFGAAHLTPGDVASLQGASLPDHDLATASFPCQDLSLAGSRAGLKGHRSGTFHEFIRILGQMNDRGRAPRAVVIENVVGLLTSHQGRDIETVLEALNALGYACDVLIVDAVHFVPQSRPRVFIIGLSEAISRPNGGLELRDEDPFEHPCRPASVKRLVLTHPHLRWTALNLPALPRRRAYRLVDLLERGEPQAWLGALELERELGYIRDGSRARLDDALKRAARSHHPVFLTAYRRTRDGLVCLETRDDGIAGCLRTPSGGSSRQLLIEARPEGSVRIRYLTAREYGLLQGVQDNFWIPDNQRVGLRAFGDAVAVPAVAWLGQVLRHRLTEPRAAIVGD